MAETTTTRATAASVAHPVTDVRDITHVAYGFKSAKALLSAIDLGIFDRLSDRPACLDEIARSLGLAKNRLETLLTVLVSLGFVVKHDDRYENAPAVQTFLVRAQPTYLGDYLLLQTDRFIFPAFAELTPVLRGEGAPGRWGEYQQLMEDPAVAAEFSRGQHAGSLGPAAALSKRIDLSGRARVLDVGGGSGAFTIALCRRNPGLLATILDFPNALDTAREFLTDAGLNDRVECMAGDALEIEWPAGHDVVLLSYLASALSSNALQRVCDRAFDTLPPGGLLVVHDFMVDDDLTGPTDAALWFLSCMFNTADGQMLTPSLVSDHMTRAGFTEPDVQPLIPDLTRIATAMKPA